MPGLPPLDSSLTNVDGGTAAGRWIRNPRCQALLVALVAGVVYFTNLGGPALWDDDEPRNAACAREMLARDDWLIPTFNEELRTDKPILIYWLMQLAYRAFGVNEFGARFWSAVLSVGTCLLTWRIGTRLYGPGTGFWGGVVLATCLLFGVSARAATTDATLVFCTTLALAAFVEFCVAPGTGLGTSPLLDRSSRAWSVFPGFRTTVAVYGSLGLAVLAKGPTGFLLPALIMLVYAWRHLAPDSRAATNSPVANGIGARLRAAAHGLLQALSPKSLVAGGLRAEAHVQFVRGTLIMFAVALPWYLLAGLATEGEWTSGFLLTHNVTRFLSSMEGHRGHVLYYAVTILVGAVPWSLPVVLGVGQALRRPRVVGESSRGDLFLLCWIGVYVAFFSLSRTKLPSYVLPCFPALAVLTGKFLQGWIDAPEKVGLWTRRMTLGGAAGVGLGFLIAGPLVAGDKVPDVAALASVGIVPVVGGLAASLLSERQRPRAALGAFAVTAMMFLTLALGFVAHRVAALQISAPAMGALRDELRSSGPVGAYGCFKPGMVFYSGRRVETLWHPVFVYDFLRRTPNACLVTRADLLPGVLPVLTPDTIEVRRLGGFLRPRTEIVVLARRPAPQAAAASADNRNETAAAR